MSFILNERADLRMFESASFGFIYSNIVLQHIEPRDQRSYLKEFVRVLTPRGVLVFQLPSDRIERESGTWGSLKQSIKSVAPAPILSAYERIRWGRRALIKMWGCRGMRSPSFSWLKVPRSWMFERTDPQVRTGPDSATPSRSRGTREKREDP